MRVQDKAPSRLRAELIETTEDMRRLDIMDEPTFQAIALRDASRAETPSAMPLSGPEIRALRQEAHLSQAVFARMLNLTTGYVSQLERGAKRPTGAALALLNVVKRKGIEALL